MDTKGCHVIIHGCLEQEGDDEFQLIQKTRKHDYVTRNGNSCSSEAGVGQGRKIKYVKEENVEDDW